MIEEELLNGHIGREELAEDIVDPERLTRLAALLDRDWSPDEEVPPLAHFVLFRPAQRQSVLSNDGHAMRNPDGMLPALPLPRRMWAGSRMRFERPLVSGARIQRRSKLVSATTKSAKSGSLVFCTVEHEIRHSDSAELLITEQQNIVYRGGHEGPGLAKRPEIEPDFKPESTRYFRVGSVEMFRYSALTFNGHRIHYDRDYARKEEGYQGLVVHGPLLATMLFDHVSQVAQGRRIAEFSFRALSPSFDEEQLTIGASIDGSSAKFCVTNPAGLAMTGQAKLVPA
ncbi:FAS1-like dehydratase domain-containing protein [Sphingorhabdus sp.]|uniref:FAS1-like dehydratase domain-containing protein n=1 Tax=Sphingorhabdus sp. TaxID=1902408 RepID=UPI004053988E